MPAVTRDFRADQINEIANHPDVLPWVSLPGKDLDASGLVADRRNILLSGDGGCLFFHWVEPRLYELHTLFLPEKRGSHAVSVIREGLRWFFAFTDAKAFVTQVPAHNRAADGMARLFGCDLVARVRDGWRTASGPVDVKLYRMTREKWKSSCR